MKRGVTEACSGDGEDDAPSRPLIQLPGTQHYIATAGRLLISSFIFVRAQESFRSIFILGTSDSVFYLGFPPQRQMIIVRLLDCFCSAVSGL